MKITFDLWPSFENWLLYLKKKKFSRKAGARYAVKSRFKGVTDYFQDLDLEFTPENIALFIAHLETRKIGDRNIEVSTINKYIQVCNNLILWQQLPFEKIPLFEDNKIIHRVPFTPEEVTQLANFWIPYRNNCAYLNARNKAIILMRDETGCRIGEAIDLEIQDVMYDRNRESPYFVIFRHTKGKRDRESSISEEVYKMLVELPRKTEKVFESYRGGGLTAHELNDDLKRRARECGIDKDTYTHLQRYSFATELDNAGASLIDIRDLLGHADVKTTQKYIHNDYKHQSRVKQLLPRFRKEMPIEKIEDLIVQDVQRRLDRQYHDFSFSYQGSKLTLEVDVRQKGGDAHGQQNNL